MSYKTKKDLKVTFGKDEVGGSNPPSSSRKINEKLWEGRYSPIWPDGKKHPRNIYAHSEEECEKLLAEMIAETKTEIDQQLQKVQFFLRERLDFSYVSELFLLV